MQTYAEYLRKQQQKKGYIFLPYIAVGDPDFDTSFEIISSLFNNGADSIELGLPFTDPSADGEVLQRSFERILKNKFTLEGFFKLLKRINDAFPEKQLAVMGYANIFYKNDFYQFAKKLATHNVRALIIPDLPFDEQKKIFAEYRLGTINPPPALINFITPTTEKARLQQIALKSEGFIYAVSLKGVTGVRNSFSLSALTNQLKFLRKNTDIPILIGFGISTTAHIKEATQVADGIIIGSLFHKVIEEYLATPKQIAPVIEKKIKELLFNQ